MYLTLVDVKGSCAVATRSRSSTSIYGLRTSQLIVIAYYVCLASHTFRSRPAWPRAEHLRTIRVTAYCTRLRCPFSLGRLEARLVNPGECVMGKHHYVLLTARH